MTLNYKPTIGLEIHVALNTKSKAFCGCPNSFGDEPNIILCPVCLGLPGALPVLNEKVVELAVKTGIILNCQIEQYSCFDRKNYFYPDLVKGYQITQYYHPIATNGYFDFDYMGEQKRIKIKRVHIEEDAGKSTYNGNDTLLNYNRSGVPLIEIVTEPEFNSGEEVKVFLEALRMHLLHGEISDCKQEEGSIRVDANTSLSRKGLPGIKTEIKNLNSFSIINKAISREIERQINLLKLGEGVQEVTLGFDEKTNEIIILREKTDADNYMYFPEYDLLPLKLDYQYVQKVKESIFNDPKAIAEDLISKGLLEDDISLLLTDKGMLDLFYQCIEGYDYPQEIMNIIKGEVLRYANGRGISLKELSLNPKGICDFARLAKVTKVSRTALRKVLYQHFDTGESPATILNKINNQDSSFAEIEGLIKEVLTENFRAVSDYKKGKGKALGYLIGLVMKKGEGFLNPQMVKNMVIEKLEAQD